MADVIAVCNAGHQFVLSDFDPLEQVIAAISWCPEMVGKKEFAGLILECGARVLWLRNLTMIEGKPKVRRFRSKQLDLFLDNPESTQTTQPEPELPLDKDKSVD